jgi:hypothetical protein
VENLLTGAMDAGRQKMKKEQEERTSEKMKMDRGLRPPRPLIGGGRLIDAPPCSE